MCITYVSPTHVLHLYPCTCKLPKPPQIYYRCSTTSHVDSHYGLPDYQPDTLLDLDEYVKLHEYLNIRPNLKSVNSELSSK